MKTLTTSDLNIEKQIVRDEINNLKLMIKNMSNSDSIADMFRIQDFQIVLEEKIKYEKSLY